MLPAQRVYADYFLLVVEIEVLFHHGEIAADLGQGFEGHGRIERSRRD
jgi:hypothetical protein